MESRPKDSRRQSDAGDAEPTPGAEGRRGQGKSRGEGRGAGGRRRRGRRKRPAEVPALLKLAGVLIILQGLVGMLFVGSMWLAAMAFLGATNIVSVLLGIAALIAVALLFTGFALFNGSKVAVIVLAVLFVIDLLLKFFVMQEGASGAHITYVIISLSIQLAGVGSGLLNWSKLR